MDYVINPCASWSALQEDPWPAQAALQHAVDQIEHIAFALNDGDVDDFLDDVVNQLGAVADLICEAGGVLLGVFARPVRRSDA